MIMIEANAQERERERERSSDVWYLRFSMVWVCLFSGIFLTWFFCLCEGAKDVTKHWVYAETLEPR